MKSNANRKEEIGELLLMSPDKVVERAGNRLVVCGDVEALYSRMAEDILDDIRKTAAKNQPLRLILPVGPTDPYPLLAERINSEALTLDHCRFFSMDEYCDANGIALHADHSSSFKGIAQRLFFDNLHPNTKHVPPLRSMLYAVELAEILKRFPTGHTLGMKEILSAKHI